VPKSCPSGAGSVVVVCVELDDVVLGFVDVDEEDEVDGVDELLDVLDDVSCELFVVVVVVVVLLVDDFVDGVDDEEDEVTGAEEGTSGRFGSSSLLSDRPMAMPITITSAVAAMMMGMVRDLDESLPDMVLIMAKIGPM
jgi:hypothetical protein